MDNGKTNQENIDSYIFFKAEYMTFEVQIRAPSNSTHQRYVVYHYGARAKSALENRKYGAYMIWAQKLDENMNF